MPILKRVKSIFTHKPRPAWAAPTHLEQIRRVFKGKTAHPNDEPRKKII